MGRDGTTIVAEGLTRSFDGQLALVDLSFDAQPGEVLAVLGPNGAGKTTTVRLLNGVLAPDRGSSRVLGIDPAVDGNEVRRRTGVLTENAGLDDRLTAWENLVVTGRIRGMNKDDAGAKATAMLERFGMADRAHHRVQGFSTGQRKRVALGRALLHDPDVLFLDEPTSGLDPEATRDVIDLIGTLAAEHGRTVVLCTHFLGEAGRLAHRMAVLDRGHLLAFGAPADLAGEIWKGLDVALDLGARAEDALVEMLAASRGVLAVRATDSGAHLTVNDRSVIPLVVASLTSREVPVYGAVPMPPTLEDVYFAVVNDQTANERVESVSTPHRHERDPRGHVEGPHRGPPFEGRRAPDAPRAAAAVRPPAGERRVRRPRRHKREHRRLPRPAAGRRRRAHP